MKVDDTQQQTRGIGSSTMIVVRMVSCRVGQITLRSSKRASPKYTRKAARPSSRTRHPLRPLLPTAAKPQRGQATNQ